LLIYSTDVGSFVEVLVFLEDGPEPFGLAGRGLVVVIMVYDCINGKMRIVAMTS
jgi:hypothetical protein